MLEVVQILENMREVQGKPAIFGENSEEFWQKKIILTIQYSQVLFRAIVYSFVFYNRGAFKKFQGA